MSDTDIPAILDRRNTGVAPIGPAAESAAKVHVAEQAETIATRIKDASAIERALLTKLEGQRDFAAEYRNRFPWGGDRQTKEQEDSTVLLTPESDDWCKSYGFHVRTVRRWCALLDAEKFVAKKNAIVDRCWRLAELWQAANYMSESVEWYTPARYLESVRDVLGTIDLDPASSADANLTVRASEFFTEEDDGLKRDWDGNVFVNPPYGKTEKGASLAGAFCQKAIAEFNAGRTSACIILVNSLHSQSWQAPLYEHTVCFVDHRIQFVARDGEQNKNPTFQNIFIYLGHEPKKFAKAFARFGYVMQKVAK